MLYTWSHSLFLKNDCCSETTRLLQNSNFRSVCYLKTTRLLKKAASEMYVISEQQNFWMKKLQKCILFQNNKTSEWRSFRNVCYFRITRFLNEEALKMYVVHEQRDFINHAIFVCFIIIITNLFDQTEKTFSDQLMMFVLTSLLTKLLNSLSLSSL